MVASDTRKMATSSLLKLFSPEVYDAVEALRSRASLDHGLEELGVECVDLARDFVFFARCLVANLRLVNVFDPFRRQHAFPTIDCAEGLSVETVAPRQKCHLLEIHSLFHFGRRAAM